MLGEASGEAAENTSTIDLSTFERTLSLKEFATELRIGDIFHFPWFTPIETISPTHTVGKGRTNLTVIAPDILQTDTTGTPFASFNFRQVPSGGPGVSVHFQPSAYGITGTASYVISFLLSVSGPTNLSISGSVIGGTVSGAGTKTVNGNVAMSVVLNNVMASQVVNAAVQQREPGGSWSWFSTSIEYPPLILQVAGLEG
ncbi:hypothetical protein [Leifsonia poae]|uniref:hypothetical protein n=1 Tax=Leifsonia poae TaxID=110933 RepID=UPI003D66E61A